MATETLKKQRKPKFYQRNFRSKRFPRVSGKWKKPRGLHNKLRRKRRGIGAWVMTGYKTQKTLRGRTKDGLMPVVVANVQQLKTVDKNKHSVIIQGTTGRKTRLAMLKEAQAKKITIANIRDPSGYIKKVEEAMEAKKKKVTEKKESKEEPKKQEKKDEKKVSKEEVKDKEEVKEQEKKELDKILTKKE